MGKADRVVLDQEKGTMQLVLNELRAAIDAQEFEWVFEAIKEMPQTPPYLALKGIACAQLGLMEESEQALKQIDIDSQNLDADTQADVSGLQILHGQADLAFNTLTSLVRKNPTHSLAMARLALIHTIRGDLREAEGLMARSVELDPSRIVVWTNLIRTQIVLQNWDLAHVNLAAVLSIWRSAKSDFSVHSISKFERTLHALQLECWANRDEWLEIEQWLTELKLSSYLADKSGDDAYSWATDWIYFLSLYINILVSKERYQEADSVLQEALEHVPEHVELIDRRVDIARYLGRLGHAALLCRKKIQVLKKNEASPEVLVEAYLKLVESTPMGASQQRRMAVKKASDLVKTLATQHGDTEADTNRLVARVSCALARIEADDGNFVDAEKLFLQVLDNNAQQRDALRGMGNIALQLGRLDDAVAWFEKVKQVDPIGGHLDLISAQIFPEDPRVLEWLEQSADPSRRAQVDAVGILFKLAQAWEKKGDYDKAFALAERANAISRKQLSYSPAMHRQVCARIRFAFDRNLFLNRRDCGYRGLDASTPVFVVGMPRSGTTLVEQILAGHTQIFGAGELGVLGSVVQGLNRWERRSGSNRLYPDCSDDISPQLVDAIATKVVDELRGLAAEIKPNARFVIDKMPHNFEHIGLIKFLFPEAKIISVRRDPRDIAISNYFTDFAAKHGGMGFAYDLEWIGQQLADHNLLMHHWHQLFPGEILEVQYEDVVEDIEGMARKMLDYIGVDWEPQVLAFNELDRPVKTASVWQVRQPIYKSSKAKWERYKDYLGPLIKGTNAKITWEPIEMVTLPEPGWFTQGVEQYKADDLDGAEYTLKKLLHHIPEHAAAKAIVGLICLRKGHASDGVTLLEQALQRCPWNKHWREDLVQALTILGDADKAAAVRQRRWPEPRVRRNGEDVIGHEGTPDEPHGIQRKASLGGGADWTRLQTTAAFE